ncbi:MAG: phosphoribosylamine--glycine ligase [Lautropia sp.]|nr:phosphoribosylamine--glycine ligase [Lautropia sp.]
MTAQKRCLVVGSGGREHAIALALARSHAFETVFVAPGNAGTALEPGIRNLPVTHIDTLALFAQRENLAFTVVGPEAPLAEGIVDRFRARGLPIFGPTRAAARLESSKDFAKAFMQRHGVPTAAYETFSDAAAAKDYISRQGVPIVVKADGLAAGKGVVVAQTVAQAHAAVDQFLGGNASPVTGQNGEQDSARVVIEAFLSGEEASFIVMADGRNVLALATSQDHKRLLNGDQGPNTGGMGAYSPAPVITPDIHARALREIILPTVRGMAEEGTPFTGFLYAGLMIGQDGSLNTLEFNCRLGDPETQAILSRLKTPLGQLIRAGIEGRLDQVEASWDRRSALCVVLAAAGYPAKPQLGDVISGFPAHGNTEGNDLFVYHAGTTLRGADVVTSGGRVMGVTGLGDSLRMAQVRAYEGVRDILFNGMQYRSDIGHLGLPANQRNL